MKFGPVPLDAAAGAILAHSLGLPDGRLRKGRVLDEADLDRLRAAGIAEVTVARLDPGDRDEDSAATALAEALTAGADGLSLTRASTGRVNVVADRPGLARLDVAAIHAVNAVDPMLTVATVPAWQRMDPQGLVATIKVIAYGVAGAAVDRATAAGRGAIGLATPRLRTVSLIETDIGTDPGDNGREATLMRVTRLGATLSERVVVPHAIAPLAEALGANTADLVCILTGSATSDLRDTAPEAVRQAGGTVSHFGMPVDPGNLLFLGEIGGRPVVGLPGCARSVALNGADWVLERLICGVPVGPGDIAAMGVGGLLKEIPQRGRPRRPAKG